MDRPYIICHMTTSLDGKVTGGFLFRDECNQATDIYYRRNRELKCDGFICGRITMEESFTQKWYPDLSCFEELLPESDYVPSELSGFYAVAFDTHGRLGWQSCKLADPDSDPGYDKAQIIEVLSEDVSGRYLGYLQSKKIPYIFAGKDKINVSLALTKLKTLFGIEKLLLEGGSILNGSFLQADAVDELSLVVAPVVADDNSKPLFTQSKITDFTLTGSEAEDGILRLTYKRK